MLVFDVLTEVKIILEKCDDKKEKIMCDYCPMKKYCDYLEKKGE